MHRLRSYSATPTPLAATPRPGRDRRCLAIAPDLSRDGAHRFEAQWCDVQQSEWIEVFEPSAPSSLSTQTPVQTRGSRAFRMPFLQRPDRSTPRDARADRDPCANRFVCRPQSTRMLDRHDGLVRHLPGEHHDSGSRRQHPLTWRPRQIDTAMPGQPVLRRPLEPPLHHGPRPQRPPELPARRCRRRRGRGREKRRGDREKHRSPHEQGHFHFSALGSRPLPPRRIGRATREARTARHDRQPRVRHSRRYKRELEQRQFRRSVRRACRTRTGHIGTGRKPRVRCGQRHRGQPEKRQFSRSKRQARRPGAARIGATDRPCLRRHRSRARQRQHEHQRENHGDREGKSVHGFDLRRSRRPRDIPDPACVDNVGSCGNRAFRLVVAS